MAGEIVVGHGGVTKESVPTLRAAAEVAKAFGATLVVVFGYDPPLTGGEVGDLRRALEVMGDTLLTEARGEIGKVAADITVETELVEGRPVESILAVAANRGARMIVAGHGGSGPLAGSVLGSVAYKLVHQSPVPVLVVPVPPD